jgi:hypothetical protein
MNGQQIEELVEFRNKLKFADSEWEKRGLNPSSSDLCLQMERLLNECGDVLIVLVKSVATKNTIKKHLKIGLSRFRKLDYDTEEKEFICDYFSQLSRILEIDFESELNKWLYGFEINSIMKSFAKFKRPDKVIETLSQNCTKCNSMLDTHIMLRSDDVPDFSFDIVRCLTCGEYNMIDKGPKIKMLKYGNYEIVEHLRKDEFNLEQAKIRLEQIKYFRK